MPVAVPQHHKLPAHPVVKNRRTDTTAPISLPTPDVLAPHHVTSLPAVFDDWAINFHSGHSHNWGRVQTGQPQGASRTRSHSWDAPGRPFDSMFSAGVAACNEFSCAPAHAPVTKKDDPRLNTIQACFQHEENPDNAEYDSPYSPLHATPDSLEVFPGSTIFALQASTPFTVFVDKAVAIPYNNNLCDDSTLNASKHHQSLVDCAAEVLADPNSGDAYGKIVKPLSDWLAAYVWKVCTTGVSLPPRYVNDATINRHSTPPPAYLTQSIQSLLHVTHLQPSAIILALWYIARLPVYFDWNPQNPDTSSAEMEFRVGLFGEENISGANPDCRADSGVQTPFRLILLGCILANKWLDDHTFSNKTWHAITDVPIKTINRLEFLALSVLSHDLSVPPRAWDQWLSHLRSYCPILSPSAHFPENSTMELSNPVIHKVIENLAHLPALITPPPPSPTSPLKKTHPEPVFVGLAARIKKRAQEQTEAVGFSSLEIDLDENGPLREEYLPRRPSNANGGHELNLLLPIEGDASRYDPLRVDLRRSSLPPPAKWSPERDPPVKRAHANPPPQYIAVQASKPTLDVTIAVGTHSANCPRRLIPEQLLCTCSGLGDQAPTFSPDYPYGQGIFKILRPGYSCPDDSLIIHHPRIPFANSNYHFYPRPYTQLPHPGSHPWIDPHGLWPSQAPHPCPPPYLNHLDGLPYFQHTILRP